MNLLLNLMPKEKILRRTSWAQSRSACMINQNVQKLPGEWDWSGNDVAHWGSKPGKYMWLGKLHRKDSRTTNVGAQTVWSPVYTKKTDVSWQNHHSINQSKTIPYENTNKQINPKVTINWTIKIEYTYNRKNRKKILNTLKLLIWSYISDEASPNVDIAEAGSKIVGIFEIAVNDRGNLTRRDSSDIAGWWVHPIGLSSGRIRSDSCGIGTRLHVLSSLDNVSGFRINWSGNESGWNTEYWIRRWKILLLYRINNIWKKKKRGIF
jgi:hypothetical protein